VPQKNKIGIFKHGPDIFHIAGYKIVHTNHIVALIYQILAEMRTDKPCTSSNKYSLHILALFSASNEIF